MAFCRKEENASQAFYAGLNGLLQKTVAPPSKIFSLHALVQFKSLNRLMNLHLILFLSPCPAKASLGRHILVTEAERS